MANDAKLGAAVNSLEGRDALQRDPDKSEGLAVTKCLRFNKDKCWIFHLGWGNPDGLCTLGNRGWKQCCRKRPGDPVSGKLSHHWALAARRASCVCPGGHQIQHHQEGIVPLCSALVWPHLECCVQFGTPQYGEDIKLFESIQRRQQAW